MLVFSLIPIDDDSRWIVVGGRMDDGSREKNWKLCGWDFVIVRPEMT